MIKRVSESFDNAIMRIIVKQIETAYVGQPNGLYHFQGSYADDKIMELIANVEAKTGQKVAIYGNALALANLRQSSAANWAEADKLDIRNQGYVGKFNGRDAIELPNFMDNNDQLVLSNKHLFIVPNGIKIVKLVNEGQADVYEATDKHARLDNQIEYQFVQKFQIGVLKSNVFGVMEIA